MPGDGNVDVKALLRIAVVYNIPMACNRATADFLLSSPLMSRAYVPSFTPEDADDARAGDPLDPPDAPSALASTGRDHGLLSKS